MEGLKKLIEKLIMERPLTKKGSQISLVSSVDRTTSLAHTFKLHFYMEE